MDKMAVNKNLCGQGRGKWWIMATREKAQVSQCGGTTGCLEESSLSTEDTKM